jgi:flagellar biosynthesis protein FlhB
MFSTHGLAELVKASLKAVLVASVGVWVVWRERDHLFGLMLQPLEASMDDFASLVLLSTLLIVASLALIAAIDVPFQLWEYHRKLRMTKEEVRQEMKEQEGDPQIKARIRAAQREMSRRRMMSHVPTADVVVTNPTHYAVALKYDPDKAGAPIVVAKGMNLIAHNIRELARENGVPSSKRHRWPGRCTPTASSTADPGGALHGGRRGDGLGLPAQPLDRRRRLAAGAAHRLAVPAGMDPAEGCRRRSPVACRIGR